MKLALEVQGMDTLERLGENFWRKWNLNCVLKDGDASYFLGIGRVIEEGMRKEL